MYNTIISPSILAMDYSQMSEQLDALKSSKATWLHFDVMDNHFVPNLTFGPDILKGVKKRTNLFMDVHIMVDAPLAVSKMFVAAGADLVTFHIEACNDEAEVLAVIEYLKANNLQAGISIKPNTPLSYIRPYLKLLDLVLIMSVEPGFGGQSFISDSLTKINDLYSLRLDNNYVYRIQIDGGINNETAKLAKAAGVDTLVAGSYIFKGDISANVLSLLDDEA